MRDKLEKKQTKQQMSAEDVSIRKAKGLGRMVDWMYDFMDTKKGKIIVYGILLIAWGCIPAWANSYVIEVLWNCMFYMLLALGCNIIVGFCGLCDLGYAARFAVGAYVTAILVKTVGISFWLTIPASIGASIIAACIIGAPALRLRSDYLAIVTLGFGEITRIVARNLTITGKAQGIGSIPRPSLFGLELTKIWMWFYIFMALVILFAWVSYNIKNSRFGRAMQFIREDEDAAEAMGVDVVRYKLWAFIIGTIFGGVAGSFWVVKMTSITPNSFQFLQSANILLAVVLGGMGKIPGVMAGAAFFTIFPEVFRAIGEARMLIFGVLLIIVMIFRPQGLWPERRR